MVHSTTTQSFSVLRLVSVASLMTYRDRIPVFVVALAVCVQLDFSVCRGRDSCPCCRGQLTRLVAFSLGLPPSSTCFLRGFYSVITFSCRSFRIANFLCLPSFPFVSPFPPSVEVLIPPVFLFKQHSFASIILLRCNKL